MANPEILPQQVAPPEVQHVAHTPEIPPQIEQATGVQAVPANPQQLQAQDGQVLAQPTAPPVQTMENLPPVNIPAQSYVQLEQMSKGDPDNTSTWFGVKWIRNIKQAVISGKRVIFGN